MVVTRTLRFPTHFKTMVTSSRRGHSEPLRLRLRRQNKKGTEARLVDDPYIFHPLVRTIEPVNQALRITKTIVNEGLPPVIMSSTTEDSMHFEDILSQIKQSMLIPADYFDCAEKLNYGQRNKGLIANVVKAVWSTAASYPWLLKQTISYQPGLKVAWRRFGYNFQVSGRNGVLFSSSQPLPNFASASEVTKTEEIPVQNNEEIISPVFELSQNSSRPGFESGFFNDVYSFPRTLIITESNWRLPHLTAQGVMFAFGRLVERAVCRNKAKLGEALEHPLSLRSLVYNDDKMALLCYQLNTLDFESDEGVKNQLWLVPEISIKRNATKTKQSVVEAEESRVLKFPENEFGPLVALLLYGENNEYIENNMKIVSSKMY